MTFEEFFKRKKINLAMLQTAEPALFAEFKNHYEQMGEKSFDHTKKYWFNKLRRQYVLPPEPKAEKVRFENQISEQTITETLVDDASTAAKPAFKPRFKAPAPPTQNEPVAQINETVADVNADMEANAPTQASAAKAPDSNLKPAYKPRFQAGKPTVAPTQPEGQKDTRAETPVQAPADESASKPDEAPASTPPKPAFKPRFKPGITKSNADAVPTAQNEPDDAPLPSATTPLAESEEAPQESAASISPKPVFKPRFKPGVTKPASAVPASSVNEEKQSEEQQANEPAPVTNASANPEPSPAVDAPKPAYKPRFTPKMVKPKPPEEE